MAKEIDLKWENVGEEVEIEVRWKQHFQAKHALVLDNGCVLIHVQHPKIPQQWLEILLVR